MKELILLLRGLNRGTSQYVSHQELGAILFKLLKAVDEEKLNEAIRKLNTE